MTNETKSILRFMIRTVLMTLPVLLLFGIWYVAVDPFKVLRKYDVYFENPDSVPARIGINKGMITFNNYERLLSEGKHPNAFIFGSSISIYYDTDDWIRHLKSTNILSDTTLSENEVQVIVPYHFDSANESLTSMSRKFKYLDEHGAELKYALLVLDPIIIGNDDSDSPPYIDPLQLTPGLVSFIKYHYTFVRGAVNADFMKSYLPTQFTGVAINNGRNLIYDPQPIVYDRRTNYETIPDWDRMISRNPQKFYTLYPLPGSPVEATESKQQLTSEKLEALKTIGSILKKQRTDYKVVITPNRAKITLNREDYSQLRKIFNPERVYDLSCELADRLETDTLLYDKTHYRPTFAREIMDRIYK